MPTVPDSILAKAGPLTIDVIDRVAQWLDVPFACISITTRMNAAITPVPAAANGVYTKMPAGVPTWQIRDVRLCGRRCCGTIERTTSRCKRIEMYSGCTHSALKNELIALKELSI